MILLETNRRAHWEAVYASKDACEVSWFQPNPELSLKLIRRTRLPRGASIIDVGGGASTLVDHLIREDSARVTVLDISARGLAQAQHRLGGDAEHAEWIAADVTSWRPTASFDLWHDRAVLHFLTAADDQAAYARAMSSAVRTGGWAVIGGFAPDGPAKCSDLDVVQHDTASLGALLGGDFILMETHGEIHVTPSGREQKFHYHLFARN